MKLTNINQTYYLKQNDTATSIHFLVTDDLGIPVDLTSAYHIEVIIGVEAGRVLVKIPTLLEGVGELAFNLDAGDVIPVGDTRLEVHIYENETEKYVVPSKGFYKLRVQGSIDTLGATVTTYSLDYFLGEIERLTVGVADLVADGTSVTAEMYRLVSEVDAVKEIADKATEDAVTAVVNANNSQVITDGLIVRMDNSLEEYEITNSAMELAENGRVVQESGRVTAESSRVSAENTRKTNEAARIEEESERVADENARKNAEIVRESNENVRIANENDRKERIEAVEETASYAAEKASFIQQRETAIDRAIVDSGTALNNSTTAETNAKTALDNSTSAKSTAETVKTQFDKIVAEAGSSNPEVVQARGGKTTLNERLDEFTTALSETARQTTALSTGATVVNGGVDALADVEIEGRTLVNVSNSNLEASKQYVLADKKSKVIVDGVTVSGVGKFTKGTTTVTTADFGGKVSGSTVANPHLFKTEANNATVLENPTNFEIEYTQAGYDNIKSLNGTPHLVIRALSGQYAQHLFSFDIIAQIERQLGIIPKPTLAEKVQWVKDNVEKLQANWHGFGSSVGGNKATVVMWDVAANAWVSAGARFATTSNGTVTKLSPVASSSVIIYSIDANGFSHLLAYAEPSDGVVASSISTDYISLDITLKATAQLITRPKIIRVENFEGKVSGSTVENPHVAKYITSITLNAPSSFTIEPTQTFYDRLRVLNDTPVYSVANTDNGKIAQQLFSFNLIEAVERNIGRIPASDVAGKVAWLKANVARTIIKWHGFGSSVGGNKATLSIFNNTTSTWLSLGNHTLNSVNRLDYLGNSMNAGLTVGIDTNGFAHYLAYAEPSDGTTPSTINTDYIDLEIELKQDASFVSPKLPLYEVSSTEYNNILTTWSESDVIARYPSVDGIQHLQGVGVVAEGENLLPPFSEWNLHANARVVSPYELELVASASGQFTSYDVPVVKGQNYNISAKDPINRLVIDRINSNGSLGTNIVTANVVASYSFTADVDKVRVYLSNNGTGTFTFKNPMLTLGSTPKPFVPRNPSYLYADVKLGAIGDKKDILYEVENQRFVRKSIEKDVVLGGDLAWVESNSSPGTRRVYCSVENLGDSAVVTKWSGAVLSRKTSGINATEMNDFYLHTGVTPRRIYLAISNSESGLLDSVVATANDWKRYFNGWKYVDGTTWNSVTGNGQTATAQVALDTKPTDYTPYKLSYALATPQIVDVTDKVEGALKVNGLTQVEVLSGVVRRERVVPVLNAGLYHINANAFTGSWLKNKASKILNIYKNGIVDGKARIVTSTSLGYGLTRGEIPQADFDPIAEYSVTYIALDKPKLTANPTNVKLTYANNIRSSLEDVVGDVQDNKAQLSIQEKAIIDLYIRVKALEVK